MQLFLPESLDFQVTPADLDRARALATMYAPPRNAPLYPSGLNARGIRGLGTALPVDPSGGFTPTDLAYLYGAGYCPSDPNDLDHSSWTAADGDTVDPVSFAALQQAMGVPMGTGDPSQCPTSAAAAPVQSCPPGWVGMYPACSAPASLATTQAQPISALANVVNPIPATIATATTPPNTPIIPMNTGISNTGGTLASQNNGSTSSTSTSSTSTTTASWFTDPTQELISGIPNWGLVAGAGVGLLALMSMGGKKR
jgi:hypothetical protein